MEIRNQNQLSRFVEEWRYAWLQSSGEELDAGEAANTICDFVAYMAEEEGLTLQSTTRRLPLLPNFMTADEMLGSFVGPASVNVYIARYYAALAALEGQQVDAQFDPERDYDRMISDFVGFMALERRFLFQRARWPVEDF